MLYSGALAHFLGSPCPLAFNQHEHRSLDLEHLVLAYPLQLAVHGL
jgi:hypothetical protein